MTDAAPSTTTDTGASPRENGGASGPKATIKNVDMDEKMQRESVEIATAALDKYNVEKDIAAQIKKEFRQQVRSYLACSQSSFRVRCGYSAHRSPCGWMCEIPVSIFILSQHTLNWGLPETKHFIYFYIGALAILIWKS
ncbi:outer dynein arm light chain 8 [Pisolithus croceorrhizus]|nr:outer dynein arm light chain 8 [Pisolithus croceorrhizus]